MRKLHSYQELLIHRKHYIELLQSGQVKPKAYSLICWHISKLTKAIHGYWPAWSKANAN